MNDTIIIAPHCDDEIIGNYEMLIKTNPIVIYDGETPESRREKALKLKDKIELKVQLFQMTIPQSLLNRDNIFYIPDPIYEIHPLHRRWGTLGEKLAREGYNIVFYSTNMNAPYIHECKDSDLKEDLLNEIYPDQSDLWKYEKKYILFEGRCQWLF